MISRTRILGLLIALLAFVAPHAAWSEDGWTEDMAAAQAQARKEHKRLLLDFTGSDWCGWCIKLEEEVFSKPAFKKYASQHLVLVKVDFPRSIEQKEALKKQNAALSEKYGIEGYPTIIVLNENGKQIGTLGYMRGGPKAFIKALEDIKK